MQTIIEIKYALEKETGRLFDVLDAISDDNYVEKQHKGKWNAAQQVEHLTIANGMTTLVFRTPQIVCKLIFPENLRGNKSFDEVVKQYQHALQAGAKSTFAYKPKVNAIMNKSRSLSLWRSSSKWLTDAISSWDENSMDAWLLPHPILGKITPRELLFFSVYHIQHHRKSIMSMYTIENLDLL